MQIVLKNTGNEPKKIKDSVDRSPGGKNRIFPSVFVFEASDGDKCCRSIPLQMKDRSQKVAVLTNQIIKSDAFL